MNVHLLADPCEYRVSGPCTKDDVATNFTERLGCQFEPPQQFPFVTAVPYRFRLVATFDMFGDGRRETSRRLDDGGMDTATDGFRMNASARSEMGIDGAALFLPAMNLDDPYVDGGNTVGKLVHRQARMLLNEFCQRLVMVRSNDVHFHLRLFCDEDGVELPTLRTCFDG